MAFTVIPPSIFPRVALSTPNSGSGAASESTQPRLLPLGVTTSAPRQRHFHQKRPLQGEVGRRKKRALEEQAASASPFHHAADGEALGVKPPVRVISVGCMRQQHTYINARVTSVS